jgi:Ca2+/H+ antiporter, TMEM165/GDT1 family
MSYLFLAAFAMVLFAELLGDKTLYAVSSLASRYHPLSIFCGISVAFMGKMLAAVMVGQTIAKLPSALVTGMSAGTFFVMAVVIWVRKPNAHVAGTHRVRWSKAVLISFAAIFFTEWGDVGQLTAATLAARYQHALIIWLAATLALATKGTLAIALGLGLRRHVPKRVLRYAAFSICLLMGVLSLLRIAI